MRELFSRQPNGDRTAKLRWQMATTMDKYVGIFRDRAGLQTAIDTIRQLKERYCRLPVDDHGRVFNTDLVFHYELGFMLDCAEAIAVSALNREESRGAHWRTDFPQRDDERWLRHTLAFYAPDGPRIDYLPVTLTRWQPQVRVY
ncbi:MAG: hypothetical protein C4289_07455 [Chloroflexota bacterium]